MRVGSKHGKWLIHTGLWLALGWVSTGHAASFDCQKAVTQIEHAICDDSSLSTLDSNLGDRYRQALADSPEDSATALRNSQRSWIKERDACASTGNGMKACLRTRLDTRTKQLESIATQAAVELDRVITSIPADPTAAASALRRYRGPLASAWLIYLHQFESSSGVTTDEARARHSAALAGLGDDDFAKSVLTDIERDKKVSAAEASLTLLRMVIEHADYDGDPKSRRPYVHCFVFGRRGEPAYRAFGALYGSTRDSFAPICEPQGDLFQRPEWKRLNQAFDPVLNAANAQAGTIRYASYASWAMLALHATVSPRDFLKPIPRDEKPQDPVQQIRNWTGDKHWPEAQREQILAAIEPARRATAEWLRKERGLSADDAAKAGDGIVQEWLVERMYFVSDTGFGDD